jgi:hypothetical protein
MRAGVLAVAATLLALLFADGAPAQAPACAKGDFEVVVNEAGSVLRDLNRQNTPLFQAKLRQLKDKRSWSNDQFLKEASRRSRRADRRLRPEVGGAAGTHHGRQPDGDVGGGTDRSVLAESPP